MVTKIDIYGNETEVEVKKRRKRFFSRAAMKNIFLNIMIVYKVNTHDFTICGNRILLKNKGKVIGRVFFKENSRCDLFLPGEVPITDVIVTHYLN